MKNLLKVFRHESVPNLPQLKGRTPSEDLIVLTNPLSEAADAIRSIHSQLQRRLLDQGIRSFAVLGDSPECGAAFITANLAVACAQSGYRTALVNADLKDDEHESAFNLSPEQPGVADWLEDHVPSNQVDRYCVNVLPNLTLIPAGRGSGRGEPLQQPNLLMVMSYLSRVFDVVIYLAPPATDLANAVAVAAAAERTVLVGREHMTCVATLQQLRSLVEQCRGKVEGIILARF